MSALLQRSILAERSSQEAGDEKATLALTGKGLSSFQALGEETDHSLGNGQFNTSRFEASDETASGSVAARLRNLQQHGANMAIDGAEEPQENSKGGAKETQTKRKDTYRFYGRLSREDDEVEAKESTDASEKGRRESNGAIGQAMAAAQQAISERVRQKQAESARENQQAQKRKMEEKMAVDRAVSSALSDLEQSRMQEQQQIMQEKQQRMQEASQAKQAMIAEVEERQRREAAEAAEKAARDKVVDSAVASALSDLEQQREQERLQVAAAASQVSQAKQAKQAMLAEQEAQAEEERRKEAEEKAAQNKVIDGVVNTALGELEQQRKLAEAKEKQQRELDAAVASGSAEALFAKAALKRKRASAENAAIQGAVDADLPMPNLEQGDAVMQKMMQGQTESQQSRQSLELKRLQEKIRSKAAEKGVAVEKAVDGLSMQF